MALLEVKNVTKQYANHKALNDVSIKVEQQKIFGLLGPNGAGKTTLIRIINAITAPDSGAVFLDGHKLTLKDTAQIGYLPEERGLYKKMKVGEQAMYLCRLKGLSKEDASRRLKYWFEKFEIETWWNKRVEELSKGMAQKVQFITTVLHNPKLLIFDEPFSGFDPVNAELLKREILELKRNGATVIFSTHNMDSVERLCDDIALINHSQVVLSGDINEIKNNYKENIYVVSMKTNDIMLPNDYILVKREYKSNMLNATIRINNNVKANELLSILMKQGDIVSFSEVLPSMNDIFIRAVAD